jgi:anti-sigma factor ChrR (cupin superfamily)
MAHEGLGSLHFADLARRAEQPDFQWELLRPSVQIHPLYGGQKNGAGPAAALLRYAPGGQVPHHVHPGYEHIYVLRGSQQDHRGVYVAGDFVVNLPGSSHGVSSPGGCLVLVVWEHPIAYVAS